MRGPSIQLYAPHTYMQDRREYNAWKSELKTADFGMVSTKGVSVFITCMVHMTIT